MTVAPEPRGSARERLARLLSGFMPVQLVYVMARLRLADVLEARSATVGELSSAIDIRPDLMRSLVRGLAGIGLLRLETDDRVSLTKMGRLLESGRLDDARLRAARRRRVVRGVGGARAHGPHRPVGLRGGSTATRSSRTSGAIRGPCGLRRGADRDLPRVVAERPWLATIPAAVSRPWTWAAAAGTSWPAVLEAYPDLEGALLDVPEGWLRRRATTRARPLATAARRSAAASSSGCPTATTSIF